jgi:hypothetical protein
MKRTIGMHRSQKRAPKPKFSIQNIDPFLLDLVKKTDHRTLGLWALDCARRVLPYFEGKFPADKRPRMALDVLRRWIRTGAFRMPVIRGASLAAHAAAREADEDGPARSAARAAGQAVATAHVPIHSLGAAIYALQAIHRSSEPPCAESAVAKERDRQVHRLMVLREKYPRPADPRRLYRSPSDVRKS